MQQYILGAKDAEKLNFLFQSILVDIFGSIMTKQKIYE